MVRANRDAKDDRVNYDHALGDRSNSNEEVMPQDKRHDQRYQQLQQQQRSPQGSISGQSIVSQDSGYISIKDFAYDPLDPLYHGYTEDIEGQELEPETDASDVDHEEHCDDDVNNQRDQNKRKSVVLPTDYVINRLAVALYDFEPENDNELGLQEGDIVFISYRHGQGWLVAENQNRTKTGLVPEEFVTYVNEDDKNWDGYEEDFQDTARPFYLTHLIIQGMQDPALRSNSNSNEQELITHEQDDNEGSSNDSDYKNQHNGSNHEENDEWEDIDHFQENLADKLKVSSQPNK